MQNIKVILGEVLLPSKTMKRRFWPLFVGAGYILLIYLLGGLKGDHIVMGSLALLDSYNEKSRLFLRCFFPFMLTGIAYDSMRYYYWQGIEGNIHIAEPYFLEKKLFGIQVAGQTLTPNEFFQIHTFTVLDIFCGFAYLVFVAEYLMTGFILFIYQRLKLLAHFGWCFFTVNLMGFITYFIYPAAPPWYVSQYGLGPARMDVRSSSAAAARFDTFFGTHFFEEMYGRGIDVYGAIPSLHVSYPFLVAWVALTSKRFRIPAIGFYLLMCFSAIYLQHHYVVDIILGTLYAVIALQIVRGLTWLWNFYQKDNQVESIEKALNPTAN